MIIVIILWLLGAIIGIVGLVFWIAMLIDCLKREFKEPIEKIAWVLAIFFLNILGAIVYYFVVVKK